MTQKIHLVFKTHLDVGYTDFAAVVLDNYFKHYIPSAIRVARQMRESERPERFIWTTGSFLIYEFLEQAGAVDRKLMEDAIQAGDITWHAIPFTTHTELMDAELYEFGLSLSAELDQRFGRHTIAAKMTDVPGHTRGIVHLLAQAGVQFLHIGVNPGSTVPGVPPLFRWQDPTGAEIVVMYESGYGSAFTIEGIDDCLAFGHTGDNLGPQSPNEVLDVYADVRKRFPGAQVFASTLDAFAAVLPSIRAGLPVVTQEIGDTWIHGGATDPIKVSRFKELSRLRSQWLKETPQLQAEQRFKTFSRRLLMVPEHTWGTDEKTYLHDDENYAAADFRRARGQVNFQKFQSSWVEKRRYPQEAVLALEELPQAEEARQHLSAIEPSMPDLSQWELWHNSGESFIVGDNLMRFDLTSGALSLLKSPPGDWSDAEHLCGVLSYQTFSVEDYERFFNQYIIPAERNNGWAREDFTKPGLEHGAPESRLWHPQVSESYRPKNKSQNEFLFHLRAEPPSERVYGCPRDFWLHYSFDAGNVLCVIDLQWFHKAACRMPEAIWFSFHPPVSPTSRWGIEKLGQEIDPNEVVEFGNRHLHASGKYVRWQNGENELRITSLDAPLVAPGKPSLLDFNNNQPNIQDGMHFNLLNNLWGTNFPMWFDEDCRFRFLLSAGKKN